MVKLLYMIHKFSRKKKYLLLISLLIILIVSCENSTPSVGSVSYSFVYDYSENTDDPLITMAIFVELFSDPTRIDSIKIISPDENFFWEIDDPQSIKNSNNSVFVGNSNLMSIQNKEFPAGTYKCIYTDVAQRSTEISFAIPSLSEPTEVDMKIYSKKRLAIYDKNANLLYYGNTNGLETNQDIKNRFPEAATMYSVLALTGGNTAVIESKTEL